MKIIPFERDDASNNPWNFPYEFPGFYPTRWITINFHAKTSHRAARATIQGCELNYFPPDEAYSSSASVAEEQKRHPFWFLLLRSSASNKLYIPIELQWQRFIDSYFFPFSSFSYAMRIRGPFEGMNRRSFQFRLRQTLVDSFRVDLFFFPSPPLLHLPINFLRFLPLSDSSVGRAKWNIGNRKSSAPQIDGFESLRVSLFDNRIVTSDTAWDWRWK